MSRNRDEKGVKSTASPRQKVALKFMDIAVSMEGGKSLKELNKRALDVLGALIQDRLKIFEVLDNLDSGEDEDDEPKGRGKKKKVAPDFAMLYQ